ncbi:MAG: hypothetical protein HC848_07680 [Limnobacter sp.]|nr:hypothetical protein [Limnobacter sp.]
MTLPGSLTIYLDATSLSDTVRSRLDALMNQPGYSNVRIEYSMGQRLQVRVRPLSEEVSAWAQETDKQDLGDWSTFQHAYAHQFATFLVRLRETSEYKIFDTKADFQKRVGTLLHQLHQHADLRETCFNLAHDAIDTCGDRVALRMLDMETVCQDKQVEDRLQAGHYDDNPQGLVDFCKMQYRQQVVAQAASAKVKTLNFCDEIEVLLGFRVALAQEFRLNVQMNTLLFGSHSQITPQDVMNVRSKLNQFSQSVRTPKNATRSF